MPKVFAYRSILALAAVAAAALVCGAQPKPSASSLPPTVEATMERVDDTVGDLQKDLARPDGMADALTRIWEIERLALHAKTMTPEHLKGGPTPEVLLGFRKAQVELMTMLLKVESAILNNDAAAANKTLGEVDDLRKRSHERFKAPKPKEGKK